MLKKKSKEKSKKIRDVFDWRYYKAQFMLRNPWFIKMILWLKKRFGEVNCPIPQNGFKKYKEYLEWNKRFWKKYEEMQKSEGYVRYFKKITGEKSSWGAKQQKSLEVFEEKFLPPVYGQYFDQILDHFGVDRNDKGFRDFLEFHVFLGKNEYPDKLFPIKWIRDNKTGKPELFIQILNHTRKEDIINNWSQIAEEQKYLPGYTGKNKKWSKFDRDIEVYKLYLQFKKPRGRKLGYKSIDGELTLEAEDPVDFMVWERLHKKYPELTTQLVRNIFSRTNKRLKAVSNR